MKVLLPLLLLAAMLWAPAASAAPSVSVRVSECESSLEQPARSMTVEGGMRTLKGARKLQMRFELQTRASERGRFKRVAIPGFGAWNTADPAPRRYVFEKRIEALTAPAHYRMVVRFRWLGAEDEPLAKARRTSEACTQADLRPDLTPERISVRAGEAPETGRYVVPIRNRGRSAAGPFEARLTVDGTELAPVSVDTDLPAGRRSELVFEGPACRSGGSVVVKVDSADAIDERDEDDNEIKLTCSKR